MNKSTLGKLILAALCLTIFTVVSLSEASGEIRTEMNPDKNNENENLFYSNILPDYAEIKIPNDLAKIAKKIAGNKDDVYWCYIDFPTQANTCENSISPYLPNGGINWIDSRAVMEIDMENQTSVDMVIWFENMDKEWIMNIGNSYSNNGGGGDSGDFSYDSELQLTINDYSGISWEQIMLIGNDYSLHDFALPRPMLVLPNAIDPDKDVVLVKIKDGYVLIENKANRVEVQNDFIFRLGLPDLEHGNAIDYHYYAAFNRVIDGDYRSGQGVKAVFFVLS